MHPVRTWIRYQNFPRVPRLKVDLRGHEEGELNDIRAIPGPAPAWYLQFMVKDSRKYAATGGWGYGQFDKDGKPADEVPLKTCFPCHQKNRSSRLRLYSLRTLVLRTTVERNETMTTQINPAETKRSKTTT